MKKIRNAKKTSAMIMGLGAVALGGVAMSAWIITSITAGTTTTPITVTVGEVKDHRLGITNITTTDDRINLDAKSDDSIGPIEWDKTGSGEDLSFTITYDVTGAVDNSGSTPKAASYFAGVTSYITIVNNDASASAGSALQTAIASSQVVLPVTTSSESQDSLIVATSISSLTTASDSGETQTIGRVTSTYYAEGTSLKVSSTYSFAWGSAFSNTNPGDYTGSDKSSIDSIIAALQSLKTASGAHLNVTLTPVAK